MNYGKLIVGLAIGACMIGAPAALAKGMAKKAGHPNLTAAQRSAGLAIASIKRSEMAYKKSMGGHRAKALADLQDAIKELAAAKAM